MRRYSPIITPTTRIAVSHSHKLGTSDYDLDQLWSPDTDIWRSQVLHIGSPKYSPNKTYAFDRSRYQHQCTITGAIWQQQPSGIYALYFDNVDDKIVIPDANSLDITQGTLIAWAKTSKTSGNNEIIVKDTTGGGANNPYLLRHEGGTVMGRIGDGNATVTEIYTTTNISTLGTFYHLVFTWDGSNIRIYTNGVEDATAQAYAYTPVTNTTNIQIAKGPYGQFNGMIGEVGIYSRAWSAGEINLHYLVTRWGYQ